MVNFFIAIPPIFSLLFLLLLFDRAIVAVFSDPQSNLINKGCSQYKVTNTSTFMANLNASISDLRTQLLNQENSNNRTNINSHFATAQRARGSDPVYAMAQCRNYLSGSDCLDCFRAAVAEIRTCSFANGARVIYDGCLLRYESNSFFDQTTLPGNEGQCGERTVYQGTGFNETVEALLTDIVAATPKIRGYFAAAKREVAGSAAVLYAVAQCAETVSDSGCTDCLNVALKNIVRCPPGADGRAVDAGCFLRYSDKAFFSANQTTDLMHFLTRGGSRKRAAIIGGVVGGVALLIFVVVFIAWRRFYKRKIKRGQKGDILGATELSGPVIFSCTDLRYATGNFSEENKLGEGGFSNVYKGTLKNGKIVAVKQLFIGGSKAKADFESEVKLISNVHHRNLIRLLGCCSKSQELLLVYEYMANGSLDKFLYGDRHGTLNWKQRFNIILGTARGLAFLHEDFDTCIIHRDIKSSNILLDADFQPKIADFGLARLLAVDQSHLSTNFAGTFGYTAPEYAIQGKLSEKVDTYSYGVVVLEIISGRKCNDVKLEAKVQHILEWAWNLYDNDMLMGLVDESLDPNEYQWEDVKKVIEIALLCIQSEYSRPKMSEVLVLLLSKGAPELKPTRPTFIDSTKMVCEEVSISLGSFPSNGTIVIAESSSH